MAEDAPTQRTSNIPAYVDKPIFLNGTSGDRTGSIWAQHRRQRARLARIRSGNSSGSGSGSDNSTRHDAGAVTGGNWMSGRNGRAMGLQEAFARTDENQRPQTAEGIVFKGAGSELEKHESPSKIPRAKSAGTSENTKQSPPRIIKEMFARAEREESERLTPAPEWLPPVNYESESSNPREGSPSPAARDRRYSGLKASDMKKLVLDRRPKDGYEKPVSQYAQDRANRARMLANPTPLFVRKTMAERGAWNTKTQTWKTNEQDMAGQTRRPSTSSFEDEPEPPLNVPRAWGSKARARPGWVRKILSPDESLEVHEEVKPLDTVTQQLTHDIPLPSIEPGSEPTPPSSRPASAQQPENDFLEVKSYLQPWDADLDFTGDSMEGGSPMLKIRPTKLDNVREREIRSLSAQAVATNRLEEIRERNSEERSMYSATPRRNSIRKDTPHPEVLGEVEDAAMYSAATPRANSIREVTATPRGNSIREDTSHHEVKEMKDDEEHLRESEGTSAHETTATGSSATSFEVKKGRGSVEGEMGHKRDDSYETLRKLARLLSQSPGPSGSEKKRDDEPAKEPAQEIPVYKPRRSASVEKILEKSRARQRERSRSISETPKKAGEVSREGGLPTESGSEKSFGKIVEKAEETQAVKPKERAPRGKVLEAENETKRRSRTSSFPKSDVDPEERITAEARLFELRDDKSERDSVHAPSRSPSPFDDGKHDETPRPKADPLSLPTPKVMGAYIETPAPASRTLTSQRSISPTYELVDSVHGVSSDADHKDTDQVRKSQQEDKTKRDSRTHRRDSKEKQSQYNSRSVSTHRERPRLINTAKRTTAAQDLRRIKLEENIEDSTLDDFDLLLENEAAVTAKLMDSKAPIVDVEHDDRGRPLTQAEKDRRLEQVILDRMALRLRNTSSSIRDARQGIERLEHEVSTSPHLQAAASIARGDSHAIHLDIKIEIPRLYTVHTPPDTREKAGWFANRNWKFTWLGLILFLFGLWYVTESAMCEVYCHPTYSSKNTWQPSDPFFPYAIPTKLDQWTGRVVSRTVGGVGTAVMDWYDPERFTRPVQPKGRPYGANDWWVGQGRPAAMYKPPDKAGSIYDDELYDY